jgi:putative peptide zinc metalloprotease protein
MQVLAVVLPALACAMILGRVGYRSLGGLVRWSRGSWGKRAVAAVVAASVFTGLAWAWWPHPGTYRPIQPGERGTFSALLNEDAGTSDLAHASAAAGRVPPPVGRAAEERLVGGEPLVAAFQAGEELPTKKQPRLALVLVPSDPEASGDTDNASEEPWVFPFGRPLPPSEGDNQALAVATTDGSMTYDVAFALVWAEGDEVLNVNEAHAYASCRDCVAVAVAFQVVLIMDNARVVVPQNIAVAANYDCYRCITAAIASQLVLSVETEPGEEQLRSLSELWGRLTTFAKSITSYSLLDIAAQLETFTSEIVAVLQGEPTTGLTGPASPSGSSTSTVVSRSASPTASASPSASPTAGQSPTSSASAGATASSPSAGPTEPTTKPTSTTSSTTSTVTPSTSTTSGSSTSPTGGDTSP